mmetsp:Transcript_22621/g.61238  ORF Transcript_22621/g.61238 Transcript_22621/m.61238 type:complete len:386 (-) Transcript_22621:627-1784(-)
MEAAPATRLEERCGRCVDASASSTAASAVVAAGIGGTATRPCCSRDSKPTPSPRGGSVSATPGPRCAPSTLLPLESPAPVSCESPWRASPPPWGARPGRSDGSAALLARAPGPGRVCPVDPCSLHPPWRGGHCAVVATARCWARPLNEAKVADGAPRALGAPRRAPGPPVLRRVLPAPPPLRVSAVSVVAPPLWVRRGSSRPLSWWVRGRVGALGPPRGGGDAAAGSDAARPAPPPSPCVAGARVRARAVAVAACLTAAPAEEIAAGSARDAADFPAHRLASAGKATARDTQSRTPSGSTAAMASATSHAWRAMRSCRRLDLSIAISWAVACFSNGALSPREARAQRLRASAVKWRMACTRTSSRTARESVATRARREVTCAPRC